MKRIDLIKLAKDAVDELKAPFKVRKEKKQLESWIIDREQKIAELEESINNIKSDTSTEFKVDNLLDKIDELALEQRRLKQGQEVLTELF